MEDLTWLQPHEKANAEIINRPLKELITKLDSKTYDVASKTAGSKIDASELDDSVQDGDFVYRGSDSKFYQGLGLDDVKENIVGYYTVIDGIDMIVWNSIKTGTDLVTGDSYYLSNETPGAVTNEKYSGAIKVGVALSDTELLVSSQGSGTSDADSPEELQYQFLLNNSEFQNCFYDVFNEKESVTVSAGASYDSSSTNYIVPKDEYIETKESILKDTETYYAFLFSTNVVNNSLDYEAYYSTDGRDTWIKIEDNLDTYTFIEAGFTSLDFKILATEDIEIKSFGALYNEIKLEVSSSNCKLRELYIAQEDIAAGTKIEIPNRNYYTPDGKSLIVRLAGVTLVPVNDYTEEDERNVSFTFDIKKDDEIEFEEQYGYVDISLENSVKIRSIRRLDKEFEILDITSVSYNDNDEHIEVVYSTGNKEVLTRTDNNPSQITKIEYYDTDSETIIAKNEFTYDSDNRLQTSTWTNL
jgi:hypothetical protein